ncbi:two-component regulator propeller domain-containing protein [Phocaeicola coprocola]|uniref:two-component regulator propeller domain-containing protein n=1 Tax=Phocaeicola coprocola TaxID=310298 RepID=UPI0022E2A2B8|nr:two-component regulator propeller domain-containing protein [Phocaeicola coprocola]
MASEVERQSPLVTNDISNQQITAFGEDGKGHIWIGTFRGLNKFSVNEYHQYFCTDDSLDIPDNHIQDIFLDSKKRLWISTVNGVCQYTDKDNFKNIRLSGNNRNGLRLSESSKGDILLTTLTGICLYNSSEECFEPAIYDFDTSPNCGYRYRGWCFEPAIYDFDTSSMFIINSFVDAQDNCWVITSKDMRCYSLSNYKRTFSMKREEYCRASYLLKNGELWMAGNQSVSIFDVRQRKYLSLPEAIASHPVLSHAPVEYIYPYENGVLLCTQGRGVFYYDKTSKTVIHQGENGFPFEVPNFKISRMFNDSQGNLWIGSVDQGYAVHYRYKKLFNNNNYLSSYFKDKSVISLSADKHQNLWIATLMDGVFVYRFGNQQLEKIDRNELFGRGEGNTAYVNQLYVSDIDGTVWMTATSNEVLKCKYEEGRFRVEQRYMVNVPMSIVEDDKQNLWIGTASSFLYVLRKGDKAFSRFPVFSGYTFIPGLLPIGNGTILASAFYQPLKLVSADGTISEPKVNIQDFERCIQRSVFIPTDLYKDSSGNIWIGTVSNGLMCYSPESGKVTPFPGTTCTDISSIEEDRQGNLWISTLYGLSKYIPQTDKWINYYEADGLGGNQFYDRASCCLDDGTLVFGGTHGVTIFQPTNMQVRHDIPLLFEDIKIHNTLVRPGKGACIDRHLSYNPDINLKYDQNGFSISFAALDYSESERLHHYYKLDGFDQYWINAHNNKEAYYANLPAGTYTFRVRITQNDQSTIVGENAIRVIVHPAPWATWWAYTFYLIAGITILAFFIRTMWRIRVEKQAVLRAEQAKAQEQFINKMNMSFFANISHEFRTPLTMISGPISLLYSSSDITGENKSLLRIVQRSVNRMLRLVNQMLDFNKLENDTLKLKVRPTEIVVFLKELTDIFRVNAESKSITMITNGLEGSFIAWIDEDKIDKIFTNLMSNALKYTPAGGRINVNFDIVSGEDAVQAVKIEVINTGQIPDDKLEKIFERYYQISDEHGGIYNWGTGIGLYYARSLARLHHGSLTASNLKDDNKVMFTLIVPVGQSAYSEAERSHEQVNQLEAFPLEENPLPVKPDPDLDKEKKTIMVVDDDSEVAYYLELLLGSDYQVVCRFNAESALEAITESVPDLILSDVVMPGKDGYWLCREIKESLQLCHIPVILVTAKTTIENQVEGLNVGVDAYVTKPFEPHYLMALIKSLLNNREKTRSLLSRSTQTDKMDENVLSPQDNMFMTELYHLMESELSNPELDVTRMTQLLKISRTKFYYKVKGLTGENPSVFFKTYKLNRAVELLKEGKYTISEIADMTGFNTLSHFSKSFKQQFGIPPSEYLK